MFLSAEYQQFGKLKFLPATGQRKEKKPELLVVSGIHGDETLVIPQLFKVLRKARAILPPYLYAPVMSRLAVNAGTRKSPEGIDFNRSFTMDPQPEEVETAKEFGRTLGPFRTVLSVHEDNEFAGTYSYTEGKPLAQKHLDAWRNAVRSTGQKLHTGYDDTTDPALGMWVEEGHVYNTRPDLTPQMFESWMVVNGLAEQVITLEIPTHSSDEAKYELLFASLSLLSNNR